ncbi:GSCFA domain-containing protein [Streptomyces sp. DSM 44915]|uniref:GSCFA domain-containing protein n=1 Tax=Streptomyces chisholmiae TaxID=3075540 RepID=A0ABU2JR46_9ACTN|nr:GSCFA domain-containing protein [Streptomyces sp. DSM 44915]MDT0267450.1 GSCFA domain-containing protein [Streptomyces sp. DSM 44915]
MNPYETQPPRAFWRSAVAEPGPTAVTDLWRPKFTLGQDEPVLTAGSCFAARIGPALLEHGMFWRDAEPPPPGLTTEERAGRQYGVFSFRTGNIYTAAMLRQWVSWALGAATPPEGSWVENGRHHDPFRPTVEPDGHVSLAEMLAAREVTLAAIRTAIGEASCLIFTLGLTEAWRERRDHTVYQVCPGVRHGVFDADAHEFHDQTFAEVHDDLTAAIALMRAVNPGLKVILTVSPVPLTATASDHHVLTATVHSKSVLRAVAGQLAQEDDRVDYFPAYEIISGFPFRGMFFEPNLRSVTPAGVAFVMSHFVGPVTRRAVAPRAADHTDRSGEAYCDDALLDYYGPR